MDKLDDKRDLEFFNGLINDDSFEKKKTCGREEIKNVIHTPSDDSVQELEMVEFEKYHDDVPDEPNEDCLTDDPSKEKKNTTKGFFHNLSLCKKIQLVAALLLTTGILMFIPVYAWFYNQREVARLERIKSPDSLYITAANREDKINIKMNEIDVNSTWNADTDEKATYKYFVFAVAGQYVVNYNLQLAHTKNNNFKYEIFEAEASNTNPGGIEGKDYIVYHADDLRIPADLESIDTHDGIDTSLPIYYSVKKDDSEPAKQISLNAGTTYTIGEDTLSFDGHYINMESGTSEYTKLADDTYHDKTYSYDLVERHSEPLYWQVTGIEVEDTTGVKNPFYHEYILKVSWDETANLADLSKYKDTDIVYITVSVQ